MCAHCMLPHCVCSWFVFKHSKPLPQDIVRFTPYSDSDDYYRGTTVLPYLEAFYQYGNAAEGGTATATGTTYVCVWLE